MMTPKPEYLHDLYDNPAVIRNIIIYVQKFGLWHLPQFFLFLRCIMNEIKLTELQIERLKEKLHKLSIEKDDTDYKKDDRETNIWKYFSTSTFYGKQVYKSYSDEELVDILRERAKKLNHSPAQKEVFWIYREYIKLRFKKWPYALKTAGLSRAAGKGGKTIEQNQCEQEHLNALLDEIYKKALELGKIPHPKDLPNVCREIKKYYSDWGDVIAASEIDPKEFNNEIVYKIENLEPEYKVMLESILLYAKELNRAPIHGEIDEKVKHALIKRCGSWRNALYQIGIEPVIRIKPFAGIYIDHRSEKNRGHHTRVLYNCHYKLLKIDDETSRDLDFVKSIYEKTGKVPNKKDVPEELRKHLQQVCGSWSNALYQIGIEQPKYNERKNIKGGQEDVKRVRR